MTFAAGDILLADQLNKMGCTVRRVATQTLNDATTTAVSWDTQDEDTDAMFAPTSTTITIPETGLWAISCTVIRAAVANARSFLEIVPSAGVFNTVGGTMRFSWDSGEDRSTAAAVIPLSSGATFTVQVFVDGAGNSTMTGALTCYRVIGGA